jgi:hypothetical protein
LEKLKLSYNQNREHQSVTSMNKKTLYIVVAVIVVVLVIGVAGVILLGNNGGTTNSTPTPTPSATVVGATSVQFSVNETTTATGDIVGYTFRCKDYNTSTEVVRVDLCISGANYSYILDAGQQKSYASLDGGATWTASTFSSDWTSYGTVFNTFVDKLAAAGNINDQTYTTSTTSVSIYCTVVNGTIDNSVFATS